MKVGHHGSSSSSSQMFIEAVQPRIAVISVGADNSYGHPDELVLDTLHSFGIEIWRTDENGTITVVCDGGSIAIEGENLSAQMNPAPIEVPAQSTASDSGEAIVEWQNATVYITETCSKYHRDSCRYLAKSQIPISLDKISAAQYTPCSVCNPPQNRERP